MAIAVIGRDRLALALATKFALKGLPVGACVPGVEPSDAEPGLVEGTRAAAAAGHLTRFESAAEVARDRQVVVVLTPLGLDEDARPDYAAFDEDVAALAPAVAAGGLVLVESTVAVGDTRGRVGRRLAPGVRLAYGVQRCTPGHVFSDLDRLPKVVGGVDEESVRRAAEFYGAAADTLVVPVTNSETAELIKLAEAGTRAANQTWSNELGRYGAARGVDPRELITVANTQPYFPLLDVGVTSEAGDVSLAAALLARSDGTRDETPDVTADRLLDVLAGVPAPRVLVLGRRIGRGPHASADPVERLLARLAGAGATLVDRDDGGAVDAVVVCDEDRAVYDLDPARLARCRAVLDLDNALNRTRIERAGPAYLGVWR